MYLTISFLYSVLTLLSYEYHRKVKLQKFQYHQNFHKKLLKAVTSRTDERQGLSNERPHFSKTVVQLSELHYRIVK